jgi:uncharacterized RDD family membrane protein YckC
MTWYYASGGQQMGPVEEAALDDLVRQGVVRDDTLVWRQGLPGWQAHGSARPRPAAPPPPAPAPAVMAPPPAATPQGLGAQEMRFCSNCGRSTPVSQLSNVSGAAVCAACLPSLAAVGAGQSTAAPQSFVNPQGASYAQASPYPQAPAYNPPAASSYAPAPPYQQAPYQQAGMQGQVRYGGFWIRFLARIIDWILLAIVGSIIRIPLTLVMGGVGLGLSRVQDPAAALAALPALAGVIGLSILINFAVSFIYEVYFVSSRGATPGKMVLGLKIVRADGGPVSMGLAAGRYFASILSGFTFMIGYIIAGFDDQKRSLHDRICDTRVIKV